jgi:hypothetical protein
MDRFSRPLSGLVVNISVSESEESAALGFPRWQVNRVTVQFAAALLGQGAAVVFGHDWREDGVMQAIYGFARQIRGPVSSDAGPMLWNLLAWPDGPALSAEILEEVKPVLHVETVGLPPVLESVVDRALAEGPDSPLARYCRARGLTWLRRRLNVVSHARICIGGRTAGFGGRYPGVAEEALLALEDSKPLYLVGLLGGAAQRVIDAMTGRPVPGLSTDPVLSAMYADPPTEGTTGDPRDRKYEPELLWQEFTTAGREALQVNGLPTDGNDELVSTGSIDRAIHLILAGLAKVQLKRENTGP